MNNINNKKMFFSLSAVLTILVVLLNCCTAIYQCAFVFISIGYTVNCLTLKNGTASAMKSLLVAIAIALIISYNWSYHIHGKTINFAVIASLASAMISMLVSSVIFSKIQGIDSIARVNFSALLVASLVDCIAMTVFFKLGDVFPLEKVMDIASREFLWKIAYMWLFSGVIVLFNNIKRPSTTN